MIELKLWPSVVLTPESKALTPYECALLEHHVYMRVTWM